MSRTKFSLRTLMFAMLISALLVNAGLLYQNAMRHKTVADTKRTELQRLNTMSKMFSTKRPAQQREYKSLENEIKSINHAINVSKQALLPLIEENSQIVPRNDGSVSVREVAAIPSQVESRIGHRLQANLMHQKFRVHVPAGRKILTKISFDDRTRSSNTRTTLPEEMSLELPTGESIIDVQFKFESAGDEDERGPEPLSLTVQVNDLPPLKHIFSKPRNRYDDSFSHHRRQSRFADQQDFGTKENLPVLHQYQPDYSLPTTLVQLSEGETDE